MSLDISKSKIDAKVFNDLSKLNNLFTNSNNRIKSRSLFLFFEIEKLKDLLNINELNKIKAKKKLKKF